MRYQNLKKSGVYALLNLTVFLTLTQNWNRPTGIVEYTLCVRCKYFIYFAVYHEPDPISHTVCPSSLRELAGGTGVKKTRHTCERSGLVK